MAQVSVILAQSNVTDLLTAKFMQNVSQYWGINDFKNADEIFFL